MNTRVFETSNKLGITASYYNATLAKNFDNMATYPHNNLHFIGPLGEMHGKEAEARLNTGYESSSGFRDAFSKIMGAPPTKFEQHPTILKASWIDTKLGPMIAIALEFVDRRGLEREVEVIDNYKS